MLAVALAVAEPAVRQAALTPCLALRTEQLPLPVACQAVSQVCMSSHAALTHIRWP